MTPHIAHESYESNVYHRTNELEKCTSQRKAGVSAASYGFFVLGNCQCVPHYISTTFACFLVIPTLFPPIMAEVVPYISLNVQILYCSRYARWSRITKKKKTITLQSLSPGGRMYFPGADKIQTRQENHSAKQFFKCRCTLVFGSKYTVFAFAG